VVSMLASGTQVRGFKPGRSRRIFRAKKSSACLPSEGKKSLRPNVVALRHVKDPYNYRGSRNCKLNSLGHFSPIVLRFYTRGLCHPYAERAWRGQVRIKAEWYNQPIGCSAHGGETHRPYSRRRRTELQTANVKVKVTL
jgi:hypothetical protein